MHLRIRYKQQGGHIHCRVFSAKAKHLTHAKNGELVFDEEEWKVVHDMLLSIAEVVLDNANIALIDYGDY